MFSKFTAPAKRNFNMLSVRGLSYRYSSKARPALHDVSFEVGHGITVLMGENGAGKSTLLRCIQGELLPDSGAEISTEKQETPAYLPQEPHWIGRFTVIDLLRYSAWWRGVSPSEINNRISEILEQFNLKNLAKKRLRELSGGQYRRIMLAQAVCAKSDIILLDEPLTGLDIGAREILMKNISTLGSGHTVIISTHEVEVFEPIADYTVILRSGKCTFYGKLDEFKTRPEFIHSDSKPSSLLRELYNQAYQGDSL